MERHWQMDVIGSAAARRWWMRAATFLLILAFGSFTLHAQTSTSDPNRLAEIKQLLAEERWQEIVRLAEAEEVRTSDLNYYYGIALGHLERWGDAERALQQGFKQQPGDKRFPLELAGIFFKQKQYSPAADYLRRALRLDPADSYANDFLASTYFLQGNLDAALKYWNRLSKPQIEEVQVDPQPKVDPVLLDHAFAFAPAHSCFSGLQLGTAQHRSESKRSEHLSSFPIRSRSPLGWEVRCDFSCA